MSHLHSHSNGGGVIGPFKCYVIQWGEVIFYREKLFGRVRFNVISIMRRWVGEQGLTKIIVCFW